jgi:hypothetical protein
MPKKLNEINSMPQMEAAFSGWFSTITLTRITQVVNGDGYIQENEENINFQGTIQPLSPEELMLKPDGQRSFEWLQIHCLAGSLNLKTNDQIVYNTRIYKVMSVKDYSLNNYIQYDILEDYQNA